jgi:hypothetical protein
MARAPLLALPAGLGEDSAARGAACQPAAPVSGPEAVPAVEGPELGGAHGLVAERATRRREGHLADLCAAAGLQQIGPGTLTVEIRFETFTDWWEPFTLGVGPAGAYVSQLDQAQREALRTRCAQLLPPARFRLSASAWSVRAHP